VAAEWRNWWVEIQTVSEISKIKSDARNETNLVHYLSTVYSVTIPLNVSGLLVVHHQEVEVYICDQLYVLYLLVY
jgi:hypothetical protein